MNPDLVLKLDRLLYVVDLTVPYDSTIRFMDAQAQRRVDKYQVLVSLLQQKYQVDRVRVFGLVVGARGLFTEAGIKVWETLGLSRKQRRCISMMALRQTCMIWGAFNNRSQERNMDK